MLAPLASGRHSIDFGGVASTPGNGEITIRARYELTVE
jgi:hypothetical protein